MKHLRTYEEINFDFDDEDWEAINQEKIREADKINRFLDYEKEFFLKVGFMYKPMTYGNRENFTDTCKEFTITIQKYKVKEPYVSYYCSINIPNLGATTAVNEEITTIEQPERIKLMRKLIRKIYMFLWSKGIDLDEIVENERKRKEMAVKMKNVDPYEEEDWTEA
jgi:hypothetical protein